jgi:hypothetical protein
MVHVRLNPPWSEGSARCGSRFVTFIRDYAMCSYDE